MSDKKIDLQEKIINKVKSQTEKDSVSSSAYKPYYDILDKDKQKQVKPKAKPLNTKDLPKEQPKPKVAKPKQKLPKVKPYVAKKSIFTLIFEFLKPKPKLKMPKIATKEIKTKDRKSFKPTIKKPSVAKITILSLVSFVVLGFAGLVLYSIVTLSQNDISYSNNSDANSQFLYISSVGSSAQLDKLVNNFDIDFTTKDERGRNALALALIFNNNQDVVSTLLSYGVDVNEKDNKGFTPLMQALIAYRSSSTILQLIDIADINAVTNEGTSVLMTAIATNTDTALINVLIEKGANVNYKNENSVTALMIAAKETKDPKVITILLDAGADPFVTDKKGADAYAIAMTNSNLNGSEALYKLEMIFEGKKDSKN